jgi:hypothetical protein
MAGWVALSNIPRLGGLVSELHGGDGLVTWGAPAPKPRPPQRQRWFQERPSPYPWEQDGLDHVRKLMPNAEPYRAWATFSFTGR